jgi:ketosteroid isomerase-like protein
MPIGVGPAPLGVVAGARPNMLGLSARTYRADVGQETNQIAGMPSTPAAINAAFAAGYNSRDVEALAALYEQDAAVTNPDGSIAVGIDAIRVHLGHLVELGGFMTSQNRYAISNGDLALVGADWEINFTYGRERVVGRSAEVVRQQSNGSWRYVLDHPGAG